MEEKENERERERGGVCGISDNCTKYVVRTGGWLCRYVGCYVSLNSHICMYKFTYVSHMYLCEFSVTICEYMYGTV